MAQIITEKGRAWRQKYYQVNKEKIKARSSAWYYKNHERARELKKLWKSKNPDKVKLQASRYRNKKRGGLPPMPRSSKNLGRFALLGNKMPKEIVDKIRETKVKNGTLTPNKGKKMSEERKRKMLETHKRNNPTWGTLTRSGAFYVARYKAKKKGNGGSHTLADWQTLKAQYNWTCPCCHRAEPEIKLTEDHIIPLSKGGSDNIENIQPLCKPCNSKKHTQATRY